MAETIELVGDRELIRKLRHLETVVARKAIRKGLRAGAKIITAEARRQAPVGESRKLRRAIKTRAAKRSRRYIGVVTQLGAGDFMGETFYGAFQEFGWHIGKRRGGKKTRRQARGRRFRKGVHFIERAAMTHGGKAGFIATATIKREIEAAMAGI